MNNGTASVFDTARRERRSALIGYVPAGFPSIDDSTLILQRMLDSGVDLLEVGLPYSDPLMDGPAIQESVERALQQGVTTDDVLSVIDRLEIPDGKAVYIMSYWNPIERYGLDRFAERFAAAGGSGVITPDLTPEEAPRWIEATDAAGIDRTFLVAPSSTHRRLERVADVCTGFIYAASTMGVTGARDQVSDAAPALVARVRPLTTLPIGVGLGISTGAQAATVAAYADGVIVGSAFIRRILDAPSLDAALEATATFAGELADGVRAPSVDQIPTAN